MPTIIVPVGNKRRRQQQQSPSVAIAYLFEVSGAFGPSAIPVVYEVPYGPCNALGPYVNPNFKNLRSTIAKVMIRANISDVLRWFDAVECRPSNQEADGKLADSDELSSLISAAATHVIAQSNTPAAEYTGPAPIEHDKLVKGLTQVAEILSKAGYPIRIKNTTPPANDF